MHYTDSILTIPATVPRQKISTSAKTEDWFKDNGLYWENRLINKNALNESDKINMKRNCNLYYHNVLDPIEVAEICNPHGLRDFVIPLDFKHYKIENPKIQVLKGEELKRRFDWRVYVSNRDAVSKKEQEKQEQYFQWMIEKIKAESFNEEAAQKELQKLQEYLTYDWQEIREVTADHLLKHFYQYLDLKTEFSRMWEYGMLNGEEIMSIDMHNGKPVVEAVDPKTIWWLKSPNSPYIDESDAVVRAYYLPLGTVIDYYYDYLTGAEIDELEDRQARVSEYRDFTYNQYYHKGDNGFLIPDHENEMLNQGMIYANDNFDGYYDEEGNIRIVHTRWKSFRKVGELSFFDETGDPQTKYVDENYKIVKSRGETIRWIWVTEACEVTRIGENVFLKGQVRDVQFRELDNISTCGLGYVGTKVDNSVYDVLKSYSIRYDAYMWRTEQAIKKAIGKVGIIDLALIPDGWDLDMWVHFATNMGFAVTDSFKEGKKGAAQGKLAGSGSTQGTMMDLEQGQFIQQNMMMLQYLENQMDKIIGINDQRQGQVSASTGLQVSRDASQASANITEPYFSLHDNVKLRTLRSLLEVAKFCLRNKSESIQYITDEMTTHIFEVDGELINEAEYGLLIGDATNDAKAIESMQKALEISMQTGQVDIIQFMDVATTNSLAKTKRKIEKDVREKQQQQQQNLEADRKVKEQAIQQAAQQHQELMADKQADRDLRKYEIDTDAATKIETETIRAMGMAQDTDVNTNQVPDVLEQNKLALEHTKHASDVFAKQLAEGNKVKIANDKAKTDKAKLSLEEKKLKQDSIEKEKDRKLARENMENDLQIARTNAKNKNKPK